MPTPEEIEAAALFLAKAASDLAAARVLALDADQDDDVVGFHAQQAVEKTFKAVVAARGLEIPRSHDIGLLLRLLDPTGDGLPVEIREADWLNPWAGAGEHGLGALPCLCLPSSSEQCRPRRRARLWNCFNARSGQERIPRRQPCCSN